MQRRVSIACVTLLFLTGCSGDSGPVRVAVRGNVTVDGRAVKKGTITFVPARDTSGPSANNLFCR